MKHSTGLVPATIEIVDEIATVRMAHSSTTIVARVLGERVIDGQREIYLDRLIHAVSDVEVGGWKVRGAISTILSRPLDPESQAL